MFDMRQYIVSIVAASIVAAILTGLSSKKAAHAALIKLLAGLFIAVTVVAPWVKIRLDDLYMYFEDVMTETSYEAQLGQNISNENLRELITNQTEAYVLEKADALGADLDIQITLDTTDPPVPIRAQITGSISPYSKARLTEILVNDIGIPEAQVIWT